MKQKAFFLLAAPFLMMANAPVAQASISVYNVKAVFTEPQTQPNDTIFTGSFSFNSITHAISGLSGSLTESMTGDGVNPNTMTKIPLTFQLASSSDGSGGLLVSTFALNTTNVFKGGGFATGGTQYYGAPAAWNAATANSYVTLDINATNPLVAPANLNKLAYGDCAAGGMMGRTCMTGNSLPGGGTMAGFPSSQTITAAVPEPEEWAMMLLGFGLVGWQVKRKQKKFTQAIV